MKDTNMTLEQARKILAQQREGLVSYHPITITRALILTGDLPCQQ
jgi:hypothetical protein